MIVYEPVSSLQVLENVLHAAGRDVTAGELQGLLAAASNPLVVAFVHKSKSVHFTALYVETWFPETGKLIQDAESYRFFVLGSGSLDAGEFRDVLLRLLDGVGLLISDTVDGSEVGFGSVLQFGAEPFTAYWGGYGRVSEDQLLLSLESSTG